MAEKRIEVDRIENIVNVFGSFDQNIRIIETELDVAVTDRDSSLRISGSEENVALADAKPKKKKVEVIEEEEDDVKPTHPTILVVAVIALLAVLYLAYQQYSIDTTFGRVSEPTFGWPAEGSDDAAVAAEEETSEEEEGGEEEESDEEE